MSYEKYAKEHENELIFQVDWTCPKCGGLIEYEMEYADGPNIIYMPSGNIIMTDVLRCDECGIDVTARQVFVPQRLDIEIQEEA